MIPIRFFASLISFDFGPFPYQCNAQDLILWQGSAWFKIIALRLEQQFPQGNGLANLFHALHFSLDVHARPTLRFQNVYNNAIDLIRLVALLLPFLHPLQL